MPGPATSRDPADWGRATERARRKRAAAAREVAAAVGEQVAELIEEGDIMGGRALVARRIEQVLAAERTGDRVLLRAAVMELSAASGAWVANLDLDVP